MAQKISDRAHQIARDAVLKSICQNKIVNLELDADDYCGVRDLLERIDDDSVRSGDLVEIWGSEDFEGDPDEWRVHLTVPPGC